MSYNIDTTKYQDFVGFTFDDTHSSDLHLFRVNDGGDRYTWDLVPTFQDKTVQVGGRVGTYLFGSDYQKRDITINVAFDNVGEEDFRKIQNWGADKKVHKLIFDEWPYKYYNAKLTNPPQLKFICFDESENYSEEAYKGNTTRRRRIYKGEGTFKFTCYEPFARGCILSERDQYAQEPEYIKVYINKDVNEPIEIPMGALKGVDTAAIYLNPDIYARDEWGMAYKDENGNYWRGQFDPNPAYNNGAGRVSTSYYAYQPQRVLLKDTGDEKTIQLVSDYQTHLYPIDLDHGFIGTIDRNGVTNGKLTGSAVGIPDTGIDSMDLDPFDDYDAQGRSTEIVQYDPKLKVTYGKSSDYWVEGFEKQEEYGVYIITKYSAEGNTVKQINAISDPIAKWENGTLNIINKNSEKVYQTIFETANGSEIDDLISHNFTNEIKDWDEKEMYNKMYVVKNATNTLLATEQHSIYMLPNNKTGSFSMRCEYEDLLGSSHIINFDIELVNANSPKLKDSDGNSTSIEYYADTTHSYNDWAPYLHLPATDPQWNGNEFDFINNPGDFDMPFIADYEKQDYSNGITDTLELKNTDKKIKFEIPSFNDEDDGIFVDSNLRIIRGYTLDNKHCKIPNNNIYNRYITEGDFFYIPSGLAIITSEATTKPEIIYEYRYL